MLIVLLLIHDRINHDNVKLSKTLCGPMWHGGLVKSINTIIWDIGVGVKNKHENTEHPTRELIIAKKTNLSHVFFFMSASLIVVDLDKTLFTQNKLLFFFYFNKYNKIYLSMQSRTSLPKEGVVMVWQTRHPTLYLKTPKQGHAKFTNSTKKIIAIKN